MQCLSDVFDIREQNDTYEFYNVVCEKMEKELKGTEQASILNDVFRYKPFPPPSSLPHGLCPSPGFLGLDPSFPLFGPHLRSLASLPSGSPCVVICSHLFFFRGELQREIVCNKGHKITGQEFIQNISVEILKLSNLYDALDGFFAVLLFHFP